MKSHVERIRKHLSPGLVVGLVALLVAVGGTSIAGKKKKKFRGLPANSVGAKQLKTPVLRTAGGSVAHDTLRDFTATCLPGEKVISGGVVRGNQTPALELLESGVLGNGWHGLVYYRAFSGSVEVTVQALCLPQ